MGTSSCWGNLADLCYANCETGWIDYFGVEEGECGEEVCNVDLEDCEGEDVCVYCPMDGSLPCQVFYSIYLCIYFFILTLSSFRLSKGLHLKKSVKVLLLVNSRMEIWFWELQKMNATHNRFGGKKYLNIILEAKDSFNFCFFREFALLIVLVIPANL